MLAILVSTSSIVACGGSGESDNGGKAAAGGQAGSAGSGGSAGNAGSPNKPTPEDRDGDGLLNDDELAGWDIQVDRNGLGTPETEHVTSDPDIADTDGDGLFDNEELQKTDPRRSDTDGDALGDSEEQRIYFSSPTAVDTDKDGLVNGVSNPKLWDGDEVKTLGTSPSLADTDGDNVSDFDEVIQNNTNPLVAQVPELELSFEGVVDVRLKADVTNGSTTGKQYGNTYSLSKTTAESRSDSVSTTATIEASATVSAEASVGFPDSSVSVSASLTVTGSYSQENTATLETSAEQTAQQDYQELLNDEQTSQVSVTEGSLSIGMRIKNPSEVPYELTNLAVSVFQFDQSAGTFKTVATLQPTLSSFTLAGKEDKPVPQQVAATGVNPDLIREFLADPSTLSFKVANFDLKNKDGINYAFMSTTTAARTGLIVIDHGDGTIQRFHMATNVRHDPDGKASGVTLGQALSEYLGITYETAPYVLNKVPGPNDPPAPHASGIQVLKKIGNKDTESMGSGHHRFWAIVSSSPEHTNPDVDFSDITLRAGEAIHIAYVTDDDEDGLFEREEQLYGSSDLADDTDGDGLSDYSEVKTSWTAGQGMPLTVKGYPKKVFTDPKFTDVDKDGLTDPEEKAAGTDPRNADTDGDKKLDGVDLYPLDPNNTVTGVVGQWGFDGNATDASGNHYDMSLVSTQYGAGYDTNIKHVGSAALLFFSNNFGGYQGACLEAATFPHVDINDFSVGFWVTHRPAPGSSKTLVSQPGTFRVRFDGWPAIPRIELGNTLVPAAATSEIDQAWHHIAFVKSGNKVSAYIDGVINSEQQVSGVIPGTASGLFVNAYDKCNYAMISGGDIYTSDSIDDLRVFDRALVAEEVLSITQN
jgi:hypothetical protein